MPQTLDISENLRNRLLHHPIYRAVNSLPRLRMFMESHCFAVWDFMSLVKRLQRDLCPCDYPWKPPVDAGSARFINEIVLGEESDLDIDGSPACHLDIYLRAMEEVGADKSCFRSFLARMQLGLDCSESLEKVGAQQSVQDFVATTMDIAMNGSTVEVASAFLYGREDPIPRMFQTLLCDVNRQNVSAPRFTYYLERHIEIDGAHHGPMGERLLNRLIDGDPGRQRLALTAAERAIHARIELWSGLHAAITGV